MRFDAISLAPNFDIPIGRYRMNDIVNLITKWILCDPEEEEALVSIPPEDLSFDDFVNFRHVPLILRESWDREVYRTVFDITTKYTEDQLLAHHMAPMLMSMGTNVRAIVYKHALSRAGLDPTPLRDALTNLEPLINEVIEHAWLDVVDFDTVKDYLGDHPALAEKYPVRQFRQLLWDLVGCEVSLEEQRLIVYASFYGIPAPERVPYQKGDGLRVPDHEVTVTDIDFEYHTQYLVNNSYTLSKEEGEREPAISPPPPTEPELDDPIVFDPMVTGIWDHLLALMTDEQKAQLKERANKETASPSYRHVSTTEREGSPQSLQSRGPSRSHPAYLGVVAMAANRTNAFEDCQAVMNVVLPCSQREAVAMFTSPPWVHRIQHCTTPEDVMEVFRLYHSTTWSDEDKSSTDPVLNTKRGAERYKRIRNRLKFCMECSIKHGEYPDSYGDDDFSSEDEPLRVETPPTPKYRPVVPGDFVLTFNTLVLANKLESQFPHRAEYWWTHLEGTLDQACTCLSMQAWIDQLKTCDNEESFKTTYQGFLDSTWLALQGEKQR